MATTNATADDPVAPEFNSEDVPVGGPMNKQITEATDEPVAQETTTSTQTKDMKETTASTPIKSSTTQKSVTTKATTTKQVTVTESKPVITTVRSTTVKQVQVVISTAKSQPTYKILSPQPETSTPGVGASGAGVNKGVIIGVSVGVVLGIVLVAAIILIVFFMRRRKKKHHKEDIMQVENPRYQPVSDRSRGQFKFTRDTGASSTPKSKNNNRDSDIEILATRSSSRKKRKAPPPPNPFGDGEFAIDRRISQDPEFSPGPLELSTFTPKSLPQVSETDDDNADKLPERKPLLNKDTEKINGTAKQDSKTSPYESDDDSGLDDKDTSKLVLGEDAREIHDDETKVPKSPDDYDKTKNPFVGTS